MSISFPAGLFKDVCQIIEAARQRVAISVNSELTLMYWHIGERINKEILHDQRAEYGKAIVSTLSAQLMELYGKDFNSRNLHRMMQFAREFSDFQIVSTLSTQLPWSAFLEVLPVDDALADRDVCFTTGGEGSGILRILALKKGPHWTNPPENRRFLQIII